MSGPRLLNDILLSLLSDLESSDSRALYPVTEPTGVRLVKYGLQTDGRELLLIRLFQQATIGWGQLSAGGSQRSDAPRICW